VEQAVDICDEHGEDDQAAEAQGGLADFLAVDIDKLNKLRNLPPQF